MYQIHTTLICVSLSEYASLKILKTESKWSHSEKKIKLPLEISPKPKTHGTITKTTLRMRSESMFTNHMRRPAMRKK